MITDHHACSIVYKGLCELYKSDIFGTDEDLGLRIESFARGAGSNLGQGGGDSISKKGTLFYFGKQAEKPNFKK